MDDQKFTITFPFDERTGWVLLFVVILIIGSIAIFALLSVGDKKATNVEWQKHTISTLTVIFTPIWVALLALVLWSLIKIAAHFPSVTGDEGASELRWHVLALVGLLTSLGGLLGTPLALVRVYTTERQTRTAEQSHITDEISKAVEQLGADKSVQRQRRKNNGKLHFGDKSTGAKDYTKPIYETITEPNLEVRIGGLLALERIKNKSPEDHVQVMEVICAYIRENMRAYVELLNHLELSEPKKLREDLKTAFTILSRRSQAQRRLEASKLQYGEQGYRPDLKDTDFSNCYIHSIDFSGVRLNNAKFSFSKCYDICFDNAALQGSTWAECTVHDCSFETTELFLAKFTDVKFTTVTFRRSNLVLSTWNGDYRSDRTLFYECGLMCADFSSASFLAPAFSQSFGISGPDIFGPGVFGYTSLPKGIEHPKHWPELEGSSDTIAMQCKAAYENWLANR